MESRNGWSALSWAAGTGKTSSADVCLHKVSHNATHRNRITEGSEQSQFTFLENPDAILDYYLSPGAARSDTFKGCNDAAKPHADKQDLSSAYS